MTREEARAGHIALWDWLSKHGTKSKCDWPGWFEYQDTPSYCFACAIAYGCSRCPVQWEVSPRSIAHCESTSSPYTKWLVAKTPKTKKKYAAIIRDLWRDEDGN